MFYFAFFEKSRIYEIKQFMKVMLCQHNGYQTYLNYAFAFAAIGCVHGTQP